MAQARSPWCLLRPVLFAGAATFAWLTLSTSAATADSATDTGSLLGGVTSSVSTLSAPLTEAIPAPAPTPAALAPSAGLLQPVVGSLVGTASTVTAPVAAVADGATAGLVNTVAPPLAEAVPLLEPLLEPVTDLVDAVASLPAVPVGSAVSSLAEALSADSITTPRPATSPLDAVLTDSGDALTGDSGNVSQVATSGTPGTIALATAGMQSAALEAPLTQDPSAIPSPLGPTSGAGSGGSLSGSNGSAAWLDTFGFNLPLPGAFPISGHSEHAPSPVSFDPGSSPD